jgi:transposase-like protein
VRANRAIYQARWKAKQLGIPQPPLPSWEKRRGASQQLAAPAHNNAFFLAGQSGECSDSWLFPVTQRTAGIRTGCPLGLLPTGLPAAISAVFPEAEIRTCVVQLMRNSLSFCSWKQRHPVARELKRIYQAESADLAAKRLEEFAEGPWGNKLPAIVQSWSRVWEQVIPFLLIQKRSAKSSARPTRSRVCTCSYARCSRTGGTFPAMRRLGKRQKT